jgi:uncharacterized protein YkwD
MRALTLTVIAVPLACAAALGSLILIGQASGRSPLPPQIAASLENLAASAGLIEPSALPREAPTDPPRLVYVATSLPQGPPSLNQAGDQNPSEDADDSIAEGSPTPDPIEAATQTPASALSPSPSSALTIPPTTMPPATVAPTHTSAPDASATGTSTAAGVPSATATRTKTRTPMVPPASDTAKPTSAASATNLPTSTDTATSVPPSETPSSSCSPTGNSGYENTVLDLINQERQNQGLPPYDLNGQLRSAARGHSQDMACNDYFSHTGSDGSSVADRVEAEGYSWSWVGENIFATSISSSAAAQQAFDAWMDSSGHRANILSEHFTEIGIGYTYSSGSTYGSYFTAVFARP